jgi:hypothetical protein
MCFAFLSIQQGAVAEPVRTPKVINGDDAAEGAWPWMVALLYNPIENSADAHYCGGVLIGEQHVLTAAHCVVQFNQNKIDVLVGETKLPFAKGNRRKILGYTVHPKFDVYTLENDLAILKLAEPVENAPVQIALLSDADLYKPGATATVLGWGFKDPQMPILPVNLQQAEVPLASDEVCLEELGRFFRPDIMVCAGKKASSATSGDGVDACYGDSGGPLVVADGNGGWKLVGIVSWGLGDCANNKTRSAYAEVPALLDFVASFPDIKPYFISTPFISGDVFVGGTLKCNTGELGGDPATVLQYEWQRDFNAISDATSDTYAPRAEDQGASISCSIMASNSAGATGWESAIGVTIEGATLDVGTPTPEPTATPSDTTPPSAAVSSFVCNSRKCFVSIVANDAGSGVQEVSAAVQLSYSASCKKQSRCSKSKNKTMKLRRGDLGSWSGSFRFAKRAGQSATLTVSARDLAGNLAAEAAVASKQL